MDQFLVKAVELAKGNGKLLGLFAALVIVSLTRTSTKKKNTLINDLKYVGRVEGGSESLEDEYDVIIIGGGTAGCVLASRLSEDPSIRVLVLESGGSGVSVLETQLPIAWFKLFGTKDDWNLRTVGQEGMKNKSKYLPQGKMLGGSSSMNALIFHYGTPEQYDEWSRSNSDPGAEIWSHKQFSKYFKKFEKYVASEKHPLVDASLRSTNGPVEVGHFHSVHDLAGRFMAACVQVGIKHVHDINTSYGPFGVTALSEEAVTFINSRGRRVSAETAYLTPNVLSRPNLSVAIHAHVTRILFNQAGETPKAIGVEFANSEHGPRFRATARKEVVLSAGTIHTPHILMLSGVGPSQQLKDHSIDIIRDLPGVGAHLMDHVVIDAMFRDNSKSTMNPFPETFKEKALMAWYTVQWMIAGSGPFSSNMADTAAFVRSTDPDLFAANETPLAGEETVGPDLEFLFSAGAHLEHGFGPRPAGLLWTIHEVLLQPTSIGSVTLKSGDPFTGPAIDPRYLTTEHDVNVLVRGLKLLLKIARAPPLADAVDETETNILLHTQTHQLDDEKLADLVREQGETIYHPCSTARMAPLKEDGVVDPYLRVHGISNLRVVDASVFPSIIAGHTAATVFAIAEQAADLIKADFAGAVLPK